jgi:hypothetical protein
MITRGKSIYKSQSMHLSAFSDTNWVDEARTAAKPRDDDNENEIWLGEDDNETG